MSTKIYKKVDSKSEIASTVYNCTHKILKDKTLVRNEKSIEKFEPIDSKPVILFLKNKVNPNRSSIN